MRAKWIRSEHGLFSIKNLEVDDVPVERTTKRGRVARAHFRVGRGISSTTPS